MPNIMRFEEVLPTICELKERAERQRDQKEARTEVFRDDGYKRLYAWHPNGMIGDGPMRMRFVGIDLDGLLRITSGEGFVGATEEWWSSRPAEVVGYLAGPMTAGPCGRDLRDYFEADVLTGSQGIHQLGLRRRWHAASQGTVRFAFEHSPRFVHYIHWWGNVPHLCEQDFYGGIGYYDVRNGRRFVEVRRGAVRLFMVGNQPLRD